MKPKKIAFWGLFGQQNLGNDCTLQAILHHARNYMPTAETICICTGPEEIAQQYNISTYPLQAKPPSMWAGTNRFLLKVIRRIFLRIPAELTHWFRAIGILKSCCMLIVPGTGILVDHTTGPLGFPYDVFKWSLAAKLCRCRLLFVSVGAGPIYHPLSRWFIKFGLSLAAFRSYRDGFSKQYLQRIGFEAEKDPVYPDLAFSLPESIMPECDNRQKKNTVVGVGLLDYHGQHNKNAIQEHGGPEVVYQNYINKTADFITWLLEKKYTVRLLIGDVRYDSSVKQDLLVLLEKKGLSFESNQILDDPVFTVKELLPQLSETDMVVSPRFHNIILALMLRKPVISVSYNEKFDSLMDGVGLIDFCQPIDNLDVEKLIAQLTQLEKNEIKIKASIKKKMEEYRRELDKQYDIIFKSSWPET